MDASVRDVAPPAAVTPRPARVNPIRDRAAWEAARVACQQDPGAFHGAIAKREIHWYDAKVGMHGAWITWSDADNAWVGFDARTGAVVRADYPQSHAPWTTAFDDSEAPFYRWFDGGLTNACFNEVDRHVLAGHGAEPAFLFEGDRWDQSLDGGRGGPVVAYPISRKRLLLEVAKAAVVLRQLGLGRGDRVAINMPNIPEQVYYTEAAKRLGVVYTPVFGGFSDKTLSDRIHNAGAQVVITADGGYRNAQVVAFKEAYTDPALDNYVAAEVAVEAVRGAVASLGLPAAVADAIVAGAAEAASHEITLERSDLMRGVGRALEAQHLDAAEASRIRTAVATALVNTPPRVRAVVVVRHTAQADILWRTERDQWHHELAAKAVETLVDNARRAGARVKDEADLLELPDRELVEALWATTAPEAVDAEFPLFIIYTSGSTGKPKGVVHVHGGYTSGIAYTMKVAFDAVPGDVMYVVADPGWITGQSYMIAAALLTRVTSVLGEGAPVFPSAGRYASMIERYGVSIFKAGVTFLKSVMTDAQNVADVKQYEMSSLRVATFCAEPTSPPVQAFGMELMTPWYINSYWATEHGGLVWTHFYGNGDYPLRADAHTYPLPWIMGDVWTAAGEAVDGRFAPVPAEPGEKGEIVITQPYPYLCRTIWGDDADFALDGQRVSRAWKGDLDRYASTYWKRWQGTYAYTQGDFAVKYDDGGFSLHGRSDDVINVSGHRLGTEEIEGAILRDKQVNPDSPVGNVIVVGAPDSVKGLTPLAFVRPAMDRRITNEDRRRLAELVRQEKGALAVPSDFLEVSQFPETRSGKYMRRMVKALVEGTPVGDTSSLRNPESIEEFRKAIHTWAERQRLEEEQQLFSDWRYFRVQYNRVRPGVVIATVTVTNAPVNALNERALDELNIVVEHVARREDVKAVIFTGQGTSSFVAGADIRQMLEEVRTIEEAMPLPNNAHLAFKKIEGMSKPCIAAINGVALGGGMEFALACHYRVAEPTASFGQPEIRLNLMPGYGGTQRLPRLLAERDGTDGLVRAMELILGGRPMTASQALDAGVIDEIADGTDSALARAAELARAFVDTNDSALGAVVDMRREARARWSEAGTPALAEVLGDANIVRLEKQASTAGRASAYARALEAIRHGWDNGIEAGLEREAELFAEAIVDPKGGKAGIRAFIDKRSTPLPARRAIAPMSDEVPALVEQGALLPVGAPFFPGFTPVPAWQYGQGLVRDQVTGAPTHGDPVKVEKEIIIPVDEPGPNEALVYVLASEVNFNDIWALTGIPVSPFDNHELDWHVTGSGGIALVAKLGQELRREGRVAVGDLVAIYSGTTELLSPMAGLDPMFADFAIQGYETDTGSHQQFLLVQGPQMHHMPPDLTLESAGAYILNLGTVVRALFTTLAVEPGKTIFVEGAATGTGLDAMRSASMNGLTAVGLVSSEERAAFVKQQGAAGAVNRKAADIASIWTVPPADPTALAAWEKAGEPFLDTIRAATGGRLADYAVSHAGETAFPRTFQSLADGGVLTFYGASSGYYFGFAGKKGSARPTDMLRRAKLRAGEAVLLYYGPAVEADGLVDRPALEAIEAARAAGARIVVATRTIAQREFVQSLGFGDAVKGVVAIEEIERKEGEDFEWPTCLPPMPDVRKQTAAFKEAVRAFQERTIKAFGSAVGRHLRSADNPRGYPDLVIERAGHDALAVSTTLVKPGTGRVVYFEEMAGRRYTFYAPQVWTRQRRILCPTASIYGTHLCNAYEVVRMNDMLAAGLLEVTPPAVVPWEGLPEAHQAMWENRHTAATYVVNHALPAMGLRSRDELFQAWAAAAHEGAASGSNAH
jgi:acrylyl-CoA reductase (NADPH)/3-hydroxypropionyl-CoA dehydratase/3-hydroxypropionyl-CoA synthetase